MSLDYLCVCSNWRNLTSHWQRGTAVQIDAVTDHPDMQALVIELGTGMVVLIAARMTQSILTLARNLHRRPLGWKIILRDWKKKASQAVLWMCWHILDVLLPVEVTNMLVYKDKSKHSTHYTTKQSMNTTSIKCHWDCKAELSEEDMVPEEQLPSPRMETSQDPIYMEEACEHKPFSDMDILVSKETLLPSCTNPFILSMICVPSEDGESSLPSEESDLSESDGECLPPCEESSLTESESEDEGNEKDSSLEDTSVDSGMQESWTPKSKEDTEDSEEESDWSDEEDSWDSESNADYSGDEDLWASFWENDDPYNPLSFAMPTRSPKQVKTELLVASSEKHQIGKSCPSITKQEEHQTLNCTMQPQAKKPVLSSFKCSHKCANHGAKPEPLEDLKQSGTKKVRFSSSVTVYHMVGWSDAYRMARKGPWEEYARDRSRFWKRIAETEAAIGFCLEPSHREKIRAASLVTNLS